MPSPPLAPRAKRASPLHLQLSLYQLLFLLITISCLFSSSIQQVTAQKNRTVTTTRNSFLIDGKPVLLRGGTIQWFRTSPELWRDRVAKFKAMGYNTVDVYVAWRDHEPIEGQFDFETKDIKKFLSICHEFGLYVYLRPGPYITNEMDTGGVPQWVIAKTTKKVRDPINNDGFINLRTNDRDYIDATRRYYTALMFQVRPYLYTNGGPIILVGIENEFTWGVQFFEYDKWSKLPDGSWERPQDQEIDIVGYISNLRDIMVIDNLVDVPITTCPGDATVSATGNVSGVIPMPNMYRNIPGKYTVPFSAWSVLQDMHDPTQHNGVYVDFPSGITETARDTNTLRSTIMSGFDAVFQFNVIAFHQEGYQNAILPNSGDIADFDQAKDAFLKFTDFSDINYIRDFFIHPPIGFFSSTLDYFGAVSPSGVLREKFYQIRRSNLFFGDFEELIGGVGEAKRSVYRSPDPDVNSGERVNYYLELAPGSAFISLYNDGVGHDAVELGSESVIAYGICFPQFTGLTVPIEVASSSESSDSHRRYTMILPVNIPLPTGSITITYSTSEILTSRPNWGSASLLVLYGSHGTQGEIAFAKDTTLIASDPEITSHGHVNGSLILSYTHNHTKPYVFTIQSKITGESTQVVIMDTYLSGKCWFPKIGNAMVCGADYLDEFMNEFPVEVSGNATIPIFTFSAPGTNGFNLGSNSITTKSNQWNQFVYVSPNAPNTVISLTLAKSYRDVDESSQYYNTSSWTKLGNSPKALDNYGFATGHSWYRSQFNISSKMISMKNFTPSLYVPFASDFIGIYLNGHYITTVNPIGTEIDNISKDPKYSFVIPKEYLIDGINHLAFRTEVWGHGSFIFFRGALARIPFNGKYIDIPDFLANGRVPSLGHDTLKGLQGNVTFSGVPVTDWVLKHKTVGEDLGYQEAGFDDSNWEVRSVPVTLSPGEIVWYRFALERDILPVQELWNGPWNLRLQGVNTKATIYLNGRLIGRWLSDVNWMRRGTWCKSLRGPWSVADEDETPIEPSLFRQDGQQNILAIRFEDAGTFDNPGIVQSVQLIVSQNEYKFTRKDAAGNVLSPVSMKIPISFA
ncbi:hypothetical protein HDU76_003859 [Blyttiomyces sp. JEL0837]|nr:hypothetical protein HDU76_003859 [Blyttiomyces sp. JEL0837]